jgi:hypothetical protein
MNHEPETPLPWQNTGDVDNSQVYRDVFRVREGGADFVAEACISTQDASYIVHACNAYPKLVEFLQRIASESRVAGWVTTRDAIELLKELGEL